jgi:biopolymer transport protein ExbB/TolQ
MIYLFGQIFVEIDPSNPDDLKEALSHMATGLSTAMYTTICGMVGALIAKVQLMNIEFGQEK